jgi:LuxR family transcriptional regulator, quorum-sensing system regulator BjaR1
MDFAQFAFDRVEAIERTKSVSHLSREIALSARLLGFDRWGIAAIPGGNKRFDKCVYLQDWPSDWFRRYTENDYLAVDPVIRRLRASVLPFNWSEAHYDREAEPHAYKVMAEATEFGLNHGVIVPIYTLSGGVAGATFASRRSEFSERFIPALHLIAIYAHARLVELCGVRPAERSGPALSPRELEVLKWCTCGLPTREIADRLGISETTVDTYIANACRKLDATNRVQAVAEALRAKLIR